MDLKKYYGDKGTYLKKHEEYFYKKQLKEDVNFLVSVLGLKKSDKILDLACGHGRHTIELKKMGFDVDGLDFSGHLIKTAKEIAGKENLSINFYKQNIHSINLKTKYDKVFLFFSEFGLFNADKVLKNVHKILKKGGLFLIDTDNVFRLFNYLKNHDQSPYFFDFENMMLFNRKEMSKTGVKYYSPTELKGIIESNGFKAVSVCGNYKKEKLNQDSRRLIFVVRK